MSTAGRKRWVTISLSGALTLLIVTFFVSWCSDSVEASVGLTGFQDKPVSKVEDERVSPANNYGFSEITPLGAWSAQADIDRAQLDDPNVPVVVAGLRIYAGKGDWRKQLMIQSVTVSNRSLKAVAKVKLGWIIISQEDRNARKNQEAALVRGDTSLFDAEADSQIKSVYLDFVKAAQPLLKSGALSGDFYLRIRVSEVHFADGSSWREGIGLRSADVRG